MAGGALQERGTRHLARYKPAASSRTHLLAAALMWTLVGAGLGSVGVVWVLEADGARSLLFLAAGLALGVAKAAFVLRRTADRAIARIRARGDGRCLGGFFSCRTWLGVLFMIAAGRLLRSTSLPPEWLGLVYTAIGAALVTAASRFWRAWWLERT